MNHEFGADLNLAADEALLSSQVFGVRNTSNWSDREIQSAGVFAIRMAAVRRLSRWLSAAEVAEDVQTMMNRKGAEIRDRFRRWRPTDRQLANPN